MKQYLEINNDNRAIPAVFWGEKGRRLILAVHGNMSNKEDAVIKILAEKAEALGYSVLSFDLPKHGERKDENYELVPWNVTSDIETVFRYAQELGEDIGLFACSMGAYFSLLALKETDLSQCLFLSPVVNMEHIIENMMAGFNVSEERLKTEKRIELPIGEILDYDYYSYVRKNPIDFDWRPRTHVLYGSKDFLCSRADIIDFGNRHKAHIHIDESGEHFYHTPTQLRAYSAWLDEVFEDK